MRPTPEDDKGITTSNCKILTLISFYSKASVREEPQIKNPQARALWEKWQHVGFMAWERMRRLHDKLNYLHELEKLKNFSWEEWRKRVRDEVK